MANREERRAAARKKGKKGNNPDAVEPDEVLGGPSEGGGSPAGVDGMPVPFPDHEEDVLFKTQMRVLNLLLGHWKKGLAIVGIALLAVLFVGEYAALQTDQQRDIQAKIADIDRRMPKESPAVAFGLQPADDSAETIANIEEGARRYEAVGKESLGAGGVMAWIKSGSAWERAGNIEKAKNAYAQAHAIGAGGTVGWSAASQYASFQADAGDIDGAIATLGSIETKVSGLELEQSKFTAALLLEDAGRSSESQALLTDFVVTYPKSVLLEQAQDALNRVGGTE